MRASYLLKGNSFLTEMDQEPGVRVLHVDFSINVNSMWLNGLFQNSCLCEIFKVKDSCAVDVIYQILWFYIDCGTEFQNDANWTGSHRMYSYIVDKVVSENNC